jgi:teichuronic acid biosynthesis glycosyltransferase TuaH
MISNENIVCVSNTTWEGFYTKSTVQIMSLLAKNNKILFVEYPFTIKDIYSTWFGAGRAPASRMLGFQNRLEVKKTDHGTNVYQLVVPPMLPIEFIKIEPVYKFLFKINACIYARSVKRTLKKLGMGNPICLNAYNAIYGDKLVGKLGEKLHVFYCYDGTDTRRYGKRADVADESFSRKVDGVIVTSDFLAKPKYALNKEVSVVKNGVDFKTFHLSAKTAPIHQDTRKKVGYIGSLDHRFDLETVEYAVQQLPGYDFEFVGELMNKNIQPCLAKYPNVTFLPPVKPNEVPDLLRNCDVGLIPYTCTEYNKNVYPLKINEYLSVGAPVVLTSFANLPEFSEVVSFTTGKESFHNAIVNEIKSDNPEKIKMRIEFAKKNSWENRTELFGTILEKLLVKKQNLNK